MTLCACGAKVPPERRKWCSRACFEADWYRRRLYERQALGVCITCGGPLFTRNHCEKHALAVRLRMRTKLGSNPWCPGKPGRPIGSLTGGRKG